jgi:hypothetical protein
MGRLIGRWKLIEHRIMSYCCACFFCMHGMADLGSEPPVRPSCRVLCLMFMGPFLFIPIVMRDILIEVIPPEKQTVPT